MSMSMTMCSCLCHGSQSFNTLTCDMTHVLHIIASIIMVIILCCVVVGLLALLKYLASGEVVGILDAIPSASLL